MLKSHIITIDGAFVRAAVRLDYGYRFIATDTRMDELDRSVWPTLADIQRLTAQLHRTGRLGTPPEPIAASRSPAKLTE